MSEISDDAPDLRSFIKAIAHLDEGLARYQQNTDDTLIRDGLIHRLQVTYELSHQVLKRYLVWASASPVQFDLMSAADVIRTANEHGLLLSDWPRWKRFREMRGRANGSYDDTVALDVVAEIPAFLAEARHLCEQLLARVA